MLTIGELLDWQATRFGEREVLVHVQRSVRYTYSRLLKECSHVARGLMSIGIQKGGHVGIWATNYLEWVLAQLATPR